MCLISIPNCCSPFSHCCSLDRTLGKYGKANTWAQLVYQQRATAHYRAPSKCLSIQSSVHAGRTLCVHTTQLNAIQAAGSKLSGIAFHIKTNARQNAKNCNLI